jgi:signal transduction histidine kinase/ligand-binding sensor domain-containing protein/DNA-binding response OmpR family regulator
MSLQTFVNFYKCMFEQVSYSPDHYTLHSSTFENIRGFSNFHNLYPLVMKIGKYIAVLFFLLCFVSITAQERIIFRQIGTRDGLSNGSIKSIVQDADGFLWFGTIGGLNKYDGIRFNVYNYSKNDPKSLSCDDVSSILIDSDQRMWIGTFGGGLNLYNRETDKFSVFAQGSDSSGTIGSNEINMIYEDLKKSIWIGTENGLYKYSPADGIFHAYNLVPENPYSLSSKSVRAIYEDSTGIFWIGTFGGGLNKFDPNTEIFTHYTLDAHDPFSISSDFILDIEPCKGYLLLGTNGGGLDIFDPVTEHFESFFKKYSKEFNEVQIVKDIYTDSKGTIWIGTDGEGLYKLVPADAKSGLSFTISRFLYSNQLKSSIGSNAIYKIFEDNQHNIWIGTAWSGLSVIEHLQGNIEFFYSDIEGIDPSPVLSVFVDSKDNMWIGSDGRGLYGYNKLSGNVIHYSNSQKDYQALDYVQVISEDRKGNLWIGTYANGLCYFNTATKSLTVYKNNPSNPASISHNNVRSVLEDSKGNLWVSTWGGGVSYFIVSKGIFVNNMHREEDPLSLSNNNVLSIKEAVNGKLWVGTFGGGLNLFDPQRGTFTHFVHQNDNPNSLSGNNILCLHKDRKENLWIGTWGAGLTKFNIIKQEFTRYDLENGLINNTVTAIEEDKNGILWLSTKKGICSLNPETNEIKTLNLSRNVRVNEFHINSSFMDNEGKLFFGGIEGLICFNPENLSHVDMPLVVKLTGFELFNKEVPVNGNSPLKKQITYSKQIVLNHKQSVFTIKFAAMDFPFSDNCQYAVKMEGFEQDWREIGTQNSATFTNLSPGKYIFKVKAKAFNSPWSENFTGISLVVKPPLYKTWWAISLYVLVFIGLLYAFQRNILLWAKLKNNLKLERLKREQESNIHQLKVRFFTNISHEIRTPLTLIIDPLNNLIDSGLGGVSIQRSLKAIKKNTDRLLHLINELLDFRKIELGKISIKVAEGNIVKFTGEIFISFREYARIHNINYTFNSSEEKIMIWFDRQQMEKVIYNLLSNAFKFTSENGDISLSIVNEGSMVKIIVKDDGVGIAEDQLPHVFERFYQTDGASIAHQSGFGIGLSIAKELIELHSGEISVQSEPGTGSTFTVALRQGKEHFPAEVIQNDYKNSEQIENYRYDIITNGTTTADVKESAGHSGQTILIVEDNNDLRTYLSESLASQFDVIEAANGKQGIDKAVRNIPDIIISDIMMPVTDGIELCRKLKSDMRTSHIPIILLTARTASLYKVEGLETGADDYMTKPFRMDELKVRIRNILNNRKLLRERYLKEALLQPKEIIIESPDEKFLAALIRIIEEHIDQPEFKLDLLSRELAMSHSVIYKKLKALTGMSMVEFVRDIKLKRAAQLLGQDKLTVTEICYNVGFTDRRYFSQVFKKKYGDTPSDFVKKQIIEKNGAG